MLDILKTTGISVAVVIVALLLTGGFGGSSVGGVYQITEQFFGQGIDVTGLTETDRLKVGGPNATSSSDFGRACWQITTNTGSTTFVSFQGTGTTVRLATSTTSCL